MDPLVEIKGLSKTYHNRDGSKTEICNHLNLLVEKGKIYSLIGNSGCGKSTLINMIGGFEKYQEGKILYSGTNTGKIGILFQDNVLFPWKTVMENMLFACRKLYSNPRSIINEQLELIGLAHIKDCYPEELSGGMKQRVALLRVLLTKPDLVILDEAFGALDFKTRQDMQDLFLEYHEREKFTAIVVTHDLSEALKLGDKVWILKSKPFLCEEIEISEKEVSSNLITRMVSSL